MRWYSNMINWLKPYLGRLVFTVLGFTTAILFMTIGFFKTVLIIVCCAAGYIIGLYTDKGLRPPQWLWFWKNKW